MRDSAVVSSITRFHHAERKIIALQQRAMKSAGVLVGCHETSWCFLFGETVPWFRRSSALKLY